MLSRLILAAVVAIAVTLGCILLGTLLSSINITVAVVLGAFLVSYSAAIGILAGAWYFFMGRRL